MDDPTPTALAVRSTTATVMDSPDSDLIGLNDYWADIDPVMLSGDTTYWVAIEAVADMTWHWFWVSGAPGGGNAVQGVVGLQGRAFWGAQDVGMVFSLTGHEVPAPGAVVLAMLGLPAVGWVKRRFA